jgi:hypothetical protein
LQAAVAALDVLKGKCNSLVKDASILSDKLITERDYTRVLEQHVHEATAATATWQARARRAMTHMEETRLRHQHTLEILEVAHADAQRARLAGTHAIRQSASSREEAQALAGANERLRVKAAASTARATEAEKMASITKQRLQVQLFLDKCRAQALSTVVCASHRCVNGSDRDR